MDLFQAANRTRPQHFHSFTQSVLRRTLVAHLSDNTHLLRRLTHNASFPNRVRQRFLAIHMFFHSHRVDGGNGMGVVGRTDRDDVDLVTQFIQHFAIILELFGLWKLAAFLCQPLPVHVTQAYDLDSHLRDVARIAVTFTANADTNST